jgi:hypothetical protein
VNNISRKYKATHMTCMVNLKYPSSQHLDGGVFYPNYIEMASWPREHNMCVEPAERVNQAPLYVHTLCCSTML